MTATRRQNGGDGATGLGAGLSYEAPGLAFSTRLRGYAWKGGGHGPSLTSSRDVLWGGPARPELRIGIRFDLPFGIGGRGSHSANGSFEVPERLVEASEISA